MRTARSHSLPWCKHLPTDRSLPMWTRSPVTSAASMAEVLQARADLSPDALAFCFLIDGEEEGPRLTYTALDREARSVAAALQDVAGPGDRALLLYAPGRESLAAL